MLQDPETKKLWGGRFAQGTDPQMWALNASIMVDRRLAFHDIHGSLAWAKALQRAGVLSAEEAQTILQGLHRVAQEFAEGTFVFAPTDEDIHTAVERRLRDLIGPLAGKLHTGRSRNDQVATDFRLWLMDQRPRLDEALADLQAALLERAEADLEVVMPGYTHLQQAQPILLGHWWLSHFWPLQRDRQRLYQLTQRAAALPLGAAALAGTTYPVDRQALAAELGFAVVAPNSLDAVSDRDFAAEFLFFAALVGVHLSRLAEAVILFSGAEFGFFTLSDAYATGSSLMPQKKNPDAFELARGKSGTLIGLLTGLLSTLKGLPSAYDKDLQEDKEPVFRAAETLYELLPVLANALRTLTVHADRLRAAVHKATLATDLADYLVEQGVPFRQAHHLVGELIRKAETARISLDDLPPEDYQALHPSLTPEVVARLLDPMESIRRRRVVGGTAPESVRAQLEQARTLLTRQPPQAYPAPGDASLP